MSNILPIFTSDYSLRSIVTLDPPEEEINNLAPVSIFSIAAKHSLEKIVLIERTFSSFIKFYKGCNVAQKHGIFGVKICVCADTKQKDEESFKTESDVIILMNNSAAYKDLIRLYSKSYEENNFYYINRLDWTQLNSLWTNNLSLVIPFYDSFLHNNLLKMSQVIPTFPVEPYYRYENHNLPFDFLIQEAIDKFVVDKSKILKTHQIYYYRDADVLAYQTYRIATNRRENSNTSINMPNLDHFSSNQFSFESYERLNNG